MAGQKSCPDKKAVRIKKLPGQKNCPAKKFVWTKNLYRQKICPDRKIVGTKKLSEQKIVGTKKMSRQILFVCISNALDFFLCPSGSWFFGLSNFCPYFFPIVQLYFRNILQFLRNIMGPSNHNLSHKTLNQVTKNSTQNFISWSMGQIVFGSVKLQAMTN